MWMAAFVILGDIESQDGENIKEEHIRRAGLQCLQNTMGLILSDGCLLWSPGL